MIIKKSSYLLFNNNTLLFKMLACLPFFFFFIFLTNGYAEETQSPSSQEAKLYWFIPDGMRADPDLFNIFEWAQTGELPNIKKMMDQGSYGFSIPTFPSHTPTNFATLFTGTYPAQHGVADGPMHTEGNPLKKVSVGGFNSAAKKVDPIWVTLEKNYNKKVALISIPGSTPPELVEGITIRGRWGGWGADFHATNFEEGSDPAKKIMQGRGSKLFFFGEPLTKYIPSQEIKKPEDFPFPSFSPIKEVELSKYGNTLYAFLYDNTDNGRQDYNKIAFSFNKKDIVASLEQNEWSEWIPATLTWKVTDKEIPIDTSFKITVVKLDDNGFFRIRFFYNNLNKYITQPAYIAEELLNNIGPMVDFVDNFPPQLIYYPEDKQTFLDESNMSLIWHKNAASFILKNHNPDVFINDIYTPNQMLTSRWWMGYIDPNSARYNDISSEQREQLWKEVKDMYKKLDAIIGELLKNADENTYVILSSDHGAVPLNKWVRLNNLFAEKGWLKFTINTQTGEPIIDWNQSTVIYLKMAHIYIHPNGLGGNWQRASGEAYQKLRDEVIIAIKELEDPDTGIKPVVAAHKWEDVPNYLDLPTDRVGDLVIVNQAGYGWNEEMTTDKKIFDLPLKTGYKQAILSDMEKGMWTPFIAFGPGIKKNHKIKKPFLHVDQYPTIMKMLNKKPGTKVDGKILDEIFE